MQRKLIERAAAVLHPVALQQFAARGPGLDPTPEQLRAVLRSADQSGMLAMAVFNADGSLLHAVPASLPFVDLSPDDYLELTRLQPISRFRPYFQLRTTFGADDTPPDSTPILEILLPLHATGSDRLAGVVQYWIDARALAAELAAIDTRISQQTYRTLAIGAALIATVVALSYLLLVRAQREIAARNERLIRANLELAFAAKASVLGQITSHLLHGLQAPVAGLRAVMATRGHDEASEDWQAAADYTARLQQMIQQTVAMLSEHQSQAAYELNALEIADLLLARHRTAATQRRVGLSVQTTHSAGTLPSDRANLLCLIAGNLIDNAIDASPADASVVVRIESSPALWRLTVRDAGPGLPPEVAARLFQPGCTTKPGGTGLGLAISHLLARQIGAELVLLASGPEGTRFAVEIPVQAAPAASD